MTQNSPATNNARTGWLAAVLITAAIVVLHFWLWFQAGAFCGDEVNVIDLAATHSLPAMTRDSFPVLLPLLVAGWTELGLGETDFQLRLLGLLIGVGTAAALWLPAWTARGVPPFWSLIIFGLNGMAIFWTDYLRAYGLGTVFLLLALAGAIALLNKSTWLRAGLFAAAAILSVQTLYQNAVFIAAISAGGWMICWQRKDKNCALKILAAAGASAFSLLPYWNCLAKWQQASAVFRPGFSTTAVLGNVQAMLSFPLPQSVWLWVALSLAMIGLGAANVFRAGLASRSTERMSGGELQLFSAVVLGLSTLGYFVFLHAAALITSPWYFLPLMAVAAVCFDLGIAWTQLPRLFRPFVLGILMATAGLSAAFAARDLNCRFSNMDCVANYLQRETSPQDYVVLTPWYLGISFHRYYHAAVPWDTLPPVADHGTYRFDLVPTSAGDLARAKQPVLDQIARVLQNGQRVWVVGWMNPPAPGRKAATPEGQFIAEHSRRFQAVDLNITGQTSDYENVSLLLADGWNTNAP